MRILITGCAGFIGFHLVEKLIFINKYKTIFGIDNLNDYYDIELKKNRLNILKNNKNFKFKKIDICNYDAFNKFVKVNKIKIIIHLAAQAGVRYSISHPKTYFKNNILGFNNVLDICKENKVKHFLFASTSSVYGNCKIFPTSENHNTNNPLTYYASSKKTNEVNAYAYSNIYKIPSTCMRFFTVYGPYGRPDMALFKFTKNILNNKPIEVYNYGNHERDFTYIDDITTAIEKLINKPSLNKIPFNVFNIGSGNPINLKKFIKLIEKNLLIKSKLKYLPLQQGDIHKTYANIDNLKKYVNFTPKYNVELGVEKFIKWYKDYYNV